MIFRRSETIRRGDAERKVSQAERSLRVKSITQSKPARRICAQVDKSRSPRFVRKVFCSPWIAGRSDSHSWETARAICAAGRCSRKAEIAGVVKMRSPRRRNWMSRIFNLRNDRVIRHPERMRGTSQLVTRVGMLVRFLGPSRTGLVCAARNDNRGQRETRCIRPILRS